MCARKASAISRSPPVSSINCVTADMILPLEDCLLQVQAVLKFGYSNASAALDSGAQRGRQCRTICVGA